ncbi:MAG TPA: hypothetical protein DCR72_10600, partial [Pseudomonas sp.]|nr:hypothetical protein [Pseudomonas sp.]
MNPCDIEISAGYASDSVTHGIGAALVSSVASAASVVAIGIGMVVFDQAQAADYARLEGGMVLFEQAQVGDMASGLTRAAGRVSERARVQSFARQTLVDTVFSSALALDLAETRPTDTVAD